MIEVKITVWTEEKQKFFKKHNFDYHVITDSLENNRYLKTYCFEDNATWYELMGQVEEPVEVTVELHGIPVTIKQTVKFSKTEYWSTESASKYFYERW